MNINRLIHLKDENTIEFQKKIYVLYWMQQSQRIHYNHALEHAIKLANQKNLPLLVYFGLSSGYPDANLRHYHFMLEGLKEVKDLLIKLKINFVLKISSPEKGIIQFLDDASNLIMDYGYLRHQKLWRKDVLDFINLNNLSLGVDMIDTDSIVPVKYVSDKAEYGAYTLRPKIKKLYSKFRDFHKLSILNNQIDLKIDSDDDLTDLSKLTKKLDIDHKVLISKYYKGGYFEASKLFLDFILNKAKYYPLSNDPSTNYTSKMSLYLHFGQISPLEILERLFLAQEHGQIEGESFDQYIEQLLVRRELALNYVTYQKGYDQFETMTEPWAYMTMREHELDKRDYLYTLEQLENAKTHDNYFNAAMKEMFYTGYMHNYMRMYWAKKIIEWMPSYKLAYDTIVYLNNKHFIDGRDANSYASIAWCFGKHDRAWTERNIFGKLRYMNDKGLERKFNINGYVELIDKIESDTKSGL